VTAGLGVLVGVDGSASSLVALRWSAFFARSLHTTQTALIAWEPMGRYSSATVGWSAFPGDWDPAADARAALDDAVVAVFGPTPPCGLNTLVREGNATRVLLEASAQATALVLGSRGHGGFAGLLIGSVSAACAEHATVPVLVVHGATPPPPVQRMSGSKP
jgi:nucleotide-binding universal stress UspA family protein